MAAWTARLSCSSPSPRACSNSCPLSQWCPPIISSCHPLLLLPSIFPSCTGSFPVSWLFTSGDQSTGASASVLLMNIQDRFLLGLTGLIFLLSKGFSRIFLNATVQKCGSDGKKSTCNAGDQGSIPELGRSSGEGNGYTFQYSCLENSMERGAWQSTIHGIAESDTTLRCSETQLQCEEKGPTPPSNSWTSIGYPRIQLNSDSKYLQIASDLTD